MAEIKVLSLEEWPLLATVPDEFFPNPQYVTAIGAVENGELVGRMCLVAMPHVEGTWVREDHRGGTIGIRMEKKAEETLKKAGVSLVLAFCGPENETYMERLGFQKVPYSVWSKAVT